jgi:glycosyltransferase involved in cell wall biosynthesis
MITYNHRLYIAEAIESVLMQKTSFAYRLIIGEDCSTDGTREVVEKYVKKYPEKITAFFNSENIGANLNAKQVFHACKAKYIAQIEGDDYWIDPNKLQKQVDFLEENPNYSFTFHNAILKYEQKQKPDRPFNKNLTKTDFSLVDLLQQYWFIPTASIVFRNSFIEIPAWFQYIQQGDFTISLLLATKGDFHYFDEVMSVYRKNSGGLGRKTSISKTEFRKLDLLNYFDAHTNFQYHQLIEQRKAKIQEYLYYKLLKESGKYKRYLNIDYLLAKLGHLKSKLF